MNEKIKLFIINYIIASIITGIYSNIINNNTIFHNLIFGLLFYFVMLKIIAILSKLYQNTCNINIMLTKKIGLKFGKNTLNFILNLIIFIILTVIKHYYFYNYIKLFDSLILWILLQIINSNNNKWKKKNIHDINSIQGLDYGTGLAYSYYYGYLKVILPSTGNLNKGLIEKIENIEDIHNIKIIVHKLFILIPSSSYIPPDLKEASYQWMESAMDLEEEVRNRAGVKRRIYHNSVYKIYPNGQRSNVPQYIVVEGATPLLTFFEVQKHSHSETNIYKKYCKEIVQKFYTKLQELIDNDPECADLCELIYYDDYDYDNKTKINIAKILLERLSKH